MKLITTTRSMQQQHEQQNDDENDDDDNEKEEEEHASSILLNNNIHHQKRNTKHRIGGSGTGASKQLGFMNENLVSKLKELGEKRQLEEEEEEEEDSKKSSFKGSFVMNKRRRKMNEEIPFPRKKLRDTLQHYSLGKAKRDLIRVIPEEDEVRLTLLTTSNRKSSSSNNNNSFRKKNVCAVIGNGGTLLAYDLGEEIDSARCYYSLKRGAFQRFREESRLANGLQISE